MPVPTPPSKPLAVQAPQFKASKKHPTPRTITYTIGQQFPGLKDLGSKK